MLVGLQLPQIVHSLAPGSITQAAKLAILVVAVMMLVRFGWIFGTNFLTRLIPGKSQRKNRVPWQQTALIAWVGMRGADSLAGALAIPFVLRNGEPFPGRDLILLLTFCVIFATLVLQGLTLAPLVRWLGVVDDHITEKEETLARLKANEAALARLEELESSKRARPQTVERLRSEYEDRIRQLRIEAPDEERVSRLYSRDFEELSREMLQTERDTIIALRNEEAINDQALRRIQRDIDLAEARLHSPG
jgi:CPA1 family monovalent cation:H+ antiporter